MEVERGSPFFFQILYVHVNRPLLSNSSFLLNILQKYMYNMNQNALVSLSSIVAYDAEHIEKYGPNKICCRYRRNTYLYLQLAVKHAVVTLQFVLRHRGFYS